VSDKPKPVHLFRGAPGVRGWSKYRQTIERWTLCGRDRGTSPKKRERAAQATEDVSLVTCRFCHLLIKSGERSLASRGIRKATTGEG
jgi:hypothetical protein